MLGRVGKRQDHRALVDARHALDDFLGERTANGADPDYGSGLDALDSSDEVPRRRMLVCIGFLEIDKVLAGRLQKSIDVEHIDPRLRFFQRHALCNERRTKQVGKANSRRARAEEQVFLIFELVPLSLVALIIPARVMPAVPCTSSL